MSKITPGPWSVTPKYEYEHPGEKPRVHSASKHICEVGNAEDWIEAKEEWEANARAIAALPDLVEAAEQTIAAHDTRFDGSNLDSTDNDGWSYPVENSLLRALRSALLKAKGEAK